MNNDALAIRYTDENYLSRQELARTLGTNLIDPFWSAILQYRNRFAQNLNLYDVSKNAYKLILTSSLNDKSILIDENLNKVYKELDELKSDSYEKKHVLFEMKKNALSFVAKNNNVLINDLAIENIISKSNVNSIYSTVVSYLNALDYIELNYNKPINVDLLATFLEILNGGGELISFYRENDFNGANQKVLINREYDGAPVSSIEPMVNRLIDFINAHNVNVSLKISIINYMFNYIKPFEKFNNEIAILLSKMLLAKTSLKEYAIYLPIENSLVENKQLLDNYRRESRKTNDLTYFVNVFLPFVENASSIVLDRIVTISRDLAEQAYFGDGKTIEQSIKEEKELEEEKISLVEEPVIKKVSSAKPKENINAEKPAIDLTNFQQIDEKTLNKMAEDLLESDPNLRPSQAHFFVRHCTIGKYYTIQQFKKAERCVYETARTSMDNLARRGYYRREQIKNKFVYTPISK